MPADDGSKARIQQQIVFRAPDGTWWHIVLVCNRTTKFLPVEVTSHPYSGPGAKMMGQPLSQVVVIPPGACLPVVFSLPGKPMQYYTDIYEWDPDARFIHRGERYHYNIDTLPARLPDHTRPADPEDSSRRHGSIRQSLPFPRSLEPAGRALRFVVRGVRGLPAGWRVEGIWPKQGQPVTLPPDEREYPLTLALSQPPRPLPAGVHLIEIDVGVVGRAFRPPNTVPLRIPLVGPVRPPRLVSWKSIRNDRRKTYVEFAAVIEQEDGLWDSPVIRFSKDRGRTWRDVTATFDGIVASEDSKLPLNRARFTFSLPTSGFRAEVLASLILRDTVGGEYHTAITGHPNCTSLRQFLAEANSRKS